MQIAILIMAAGASRRMGDSIKQLLPWKGTNLINHTINIARSSDGDSLNVILGAFAEEIKNTLPSGIKVHTCNNWEEGLGTSIAYGARQIISSENAFDKILILLADQPFIDTAYINELIKVAKNSDKLIIATRYGDKAGVPAVFDKKLFSEICKLKGATGAKKLIIKYKDQAILLANPAAQKDIDTEEDFRNYELK